MNFVQPEQKKKTPSEILDDMTLFDDDLMSKVFDNNIAAANLLLRIILENENIEVISVEGQKELENPLVEGRNICLDIFAKDKNGIIITLKCKERIPEQVLKEQDFTVQCWIPEC